MTTISDRFPEPSRLPDIAALPSEAAIIMEVLVECPELRPAVRRAVFAQATKVPARLIALLERIDQAEQAE